MLEFLAWALRLAAAVLAVLGGVALWAAAPQDSANRVLTREEADCSYARTMAAVGGVPGRSAPTPPPAAGACPPERRTVWDEEGRNKGLLIGGTALATLILSAFLASAARRERLAEDLLEESRRRHD